MIFPVLARRSILSTSAEPTAQTLYARAGLGPDDIDGAIVLPNWRPPPR
ncbi:MAG: hypothetical protein ABW122_12205 [Ilumatobacteraceae bacterium]